MTIEVIFGVVQAIVTAIAGVVFKKSEIPNRFIPIQNIVIGVIAGILAYCFKIYDNIGIALMLTLSISMGVGGLYDATQIPNKIDEIPETNGELPTFEDEDNDLEEE